MKLFFDSEFTGLTQDAKLLSIALVDEDGREFYAEFAEAKQYTLNAWVQQNVLPHMHWLNKPDSHEETRHREQSTWIFANKETVCIALKKWLLQYDTVEMWADCPAYDWVLFCQLFGGSLQLPKPLSYIVNDFATLLTINNIPPLTPRTQLIAPERLPAGQEHNALYDAKILKSCIETWRENKGFYLS